MLPSFPHARSLRHGPVLFLALAAGCAAGDGDGTDKDGTDTDADGTQDPQVFQPLVETRTLEEGDPTCAFGGTEIVLGVDDGAGDGGVASDGTLQDGEIDSRQIICNGTPGVDAEVESTLPADPPGGTPGTARILLNGGDADDSGGEGAPHGEGGEGGAIFLSGQPGSRFGHVKAFTTGTVDPGFTLPTATLSLGTEPWEVGADVTVPVYLTATDAKNGEVFQLKGNPQLNRSTGGGASVRITGVHVQPGVTLKLGDLTGTGQAALELPEALRNEGTITTEHTAPQILAFAPVGTVRLPLGLDLGGYQGLAGSRILLDGAPGTNAEPAGAAGSLSMSVARVTPRGLRFGVFVNAGQIDASGAEGSPPSQGATVTISAALGVFNTGPIDVSAGASLGTSGRKGGIINLQSDGGPVFTSSALTLDGSTGGPVAGDGGATTLSGIMVRVGGSISANGGTPDAATCLDCTGRPGGTVTVGSGSTIVFGADVMLRGGNGSARAGGTWGGNGGTFSLQVSESTLSGAAPSPSGIDVGGSLDLQGGTGISQGGHGGVVAAGLSAPYSPAAEVRFLGYAGFELDGGSGYYGANGGRYNAVNASSQIGDGGGVHSDVPVMARGGAGKYDGGDGGNVYLATTQGPGGEGGGASFGPAPGQSATNAGAIDISGGPSDEYGGSGGTVSIFGLAGASNSGLITSNGGAATQTLGGAGGGGRGSQGKLQAAAVQVVVQPESSSGAALALFSATGEARNTGEVRASGAAGPTGGDGGVVAIVGQPAVNTATCTLAGGASTADIGAQGGELSLDTPLGTSSQTGTANVAGGTGTPQGPRGYVLVDGANVTDQFTP
ncbi:MAG: hypothetical protein H6732_16445 [Alphaproteobacteria bacterium]|nr:hypothetical protein [Alphaproteobacteria bacterium]